MPRQGIGKRSQAGNWQSVPGRDCKTCPGRALANVPRQGIGKRSQAGNWQASQAGTASMPRQGMHTGKRSQAGNWQASQAGTANVPRQGTGKCSQAGNRRRPQAGDSGCSHARNCRHCKSLATICHQPRGATPPPTSRVLCDELACLLTGRGAIVNISFKPISLHVYLCPSASIPILLTPCPRVLLTEHGQRTEPMTFTQSRIEKCCKLTPSRSSGCPLLTNRVLREVAPSISQ